MNRMRTSLTVCLFAMAAAVAQVPEVGVPRLVNFSGVLKDQTGKPRTGPLALTFALYDDQESRIPLWQETQSVTMDEQGHYTVQLGGAMPDGIPMDLFASGKALWLGIRPTGGNEPEQPRSLLVSVPYALKAADADTLGGKPASAYVLARSESATTAVSSAGTSESVAQPNPLQLLPQAACASLTADGAATANQVAIYSGTCALTEQTSFVNLSGHVGIGTTAPDTPLEVNGPMQTVSAITNNYYDVIGFTPSRAGTATGTVKFTMPKFGSDTMVQIYIRGYDYSSLGAWQVIVAGYNDSNHTWYHDSVQFSGRVPFTSVRLGNDGAHDVLLLGTTSTAWTDGMIEIAEVIAAFDGTTGWGTRWTAALLTSESGLTITSGTLTPDIYTNASGKIGIGTQTPAATLEVNGTAKLDGLATFAAGQMFPGTLTGATTGGGLAVSSSTVGLTTSCATGQVLSWSGSAWQCASGGGGGGGAITGVTAGTDLTGGGTSGPVTLSLNTTLVPQLASPNTFTSSQTVTASTPAVTALSITATDTSAANTAVDGLADGPNGTGVIGEADSGASSVGVWGLSASGLAGLFSGNVNVTGSLSKSGGSFKIDDPIDPANKYLYHSFVESPDMKNIYDGVAVLDANGAAVIQLPAWFQALNSDFRYQLTCVGAFAPVYISQEVSNNQFGIAGGKAGMKVSWQVTGIRQDAWANANRIPVEQDKREQERGYYLHPELFGAPPDRNVLFADHPEMLGKSAATK